MSFTYERAEHTDVEIGGDTMGYAGGTDLLPLHKVGLVHPSRLIDLKTSGLPSEVVRTGDGWRIGALATLADLEDHGDLRGALPAIHAAVRQAGTRQIRNRATVGGNLLQRPRCRYYRDEATRCWFAGGDECPARHGRNEHHAVFGQGPCVAVQPSDLASVLVALEASVVLGDGREVPVEDLLCTPTEDHRSLNRLSDRDTIAEITVPSLPDVRTAYRKAMDRAAWQFALCGVAAAVVDGADGAVDHVRLVATGVAATPHRLHAAEAALADRPMTASTIAAAAEAATAGATPLEENGYKLPLLRGLVTRALDGL